MEPAPPIVAGRGRHVTAPLTRKAETAPSSPAWSPASLAISVVTYEPDLAMLSATLASLRAAVVFARAAGLLGDVRVDVIDNGTAAEASLDEAVREQLARDSGIVYRVLRGHGNVGYGRGHNLSILHGHGEYHLVLNPDVLMDPDSLAEGIRFLEAHRDVGLLAPYVRDEEGAPQYLCRAYPSVLVLFLRGFAPRAIRRLFRRYMHAHELRDRIGDEVVRGVPLISGCFMLGRREIFQRAGGFPDAYFLYFEDSELTLAMRRHADVAYVPTVRIVHFGGGAARKGWTHTRLFIASALTFFRRNGWRLV